MSRRTCYDWWKTLQRRWQPGRSGAAAGNRLANCIRLKLEPLEQRRLPAVLTVNTTADENDGIGTGGISLRDAIAAAASGDTINFGVTGQITLENGQLTIDKNLSIAGPGADRLTIRAKVPQSAARLFQIDDGNSIADKTVSISGLTLTSGNAGGNGGAILNGEMLSLTNCAIQRNHASGDGGGVYSTGPLTVVGSTFSDNRSNTAGGGIAAESGLALTSSTISGNKAGSNGGGIRTTTGIVDIRHSTIADNRASTMGGGLSVGSSTVSLSHAIIAGNSTGNSTTATPNDIDGTVSSTYSIIQNTGGAFIIDMGGTQSGIDPKLGAFGDNGGTTFTYSLLTGSPAIDMGDPAAAAGAGGVPALDQRGNPFGRVTNGDGAGGARIDIGAFETQTPPTQHAYLVDILADESDGNWVPGDLSLREAIQLANANAGTADTITFAAALAHGTILLQRGELTISDALSIQGLGADLLTIDASGNDPTPTQNNGDGSGVFEITDHKDANLIVVTISGLTLTGGDRAGKGGAIDNFEKLTVTACKITGNSATGDGGGIASRQGELRVVDSTISGNTLDGDYGGYGSGGGIAAFSYLSIVGSLIFDNRAHEGSGISTSSIESTAADSATVARSTVSNNSATTDGVRISNEPTHTLAVNDSTITGNGLDADYGGYGSGGGVAAFKYLSIVGSMIFDNHAQRGGGVSTISTDSSPGQSAIITRSTIRNNSATADGGGISNDPTRMLTVSDSTISGNTAANGAGVFNAGTLTMTQVTLSGNIAQSNGGGLYNGTYNDAYGPATLQFVTITSNQAVFGSGGGIAASVETHILSSIVSANTGGDVDDVSGGSSPFQSDGYNLIGTGNAVGGFNQPGDVTNNSNPMLGPLDDNGGPTMTHAPQIGSAAIDTGKASAVGGLDGVPQYDQRGAPFQRVRDGDDTGGARIDKGAVERQPLPAAFYGDYNQNGFVDAVDYVVWRKTLGATGVAAYSGADGDGNGAIGSGDYNVWRSHFGQQVPAIGVGSVDVVAGSGESDGTELAAVRRSVPDDGVVDGRPAQAVPLSTAIAEGEVRLDAKAPPSLAISNVSGSMLPPTSKATSPARAGGRANPISWTLVRHRDNALIGWLDSNTKSCRDDEGGANWSASAVSEQETIEDEIALCDDVFESLAVGFL